MTIIYIDSFFATGSSGDTKPVNAPVGFRFLETDSGRLYYWDGNSWNAITGGAAGSWSPLEAEELQNKTINLDLNTLLRNGQAVGLFQFNSSGGYSFLPIGSSNLYLKVNSQGTGFEFGDPAVTGSWDPTATEVLTNKTLNVLANHIKQTTPAAGALLLDNGTDFIPLSKGQIGQVLKVKSDGTVGWATDEVGEGGTGGSVTGSAFLPSEANRFAGWYSGGTATDQSLAHGELAGNLKLETSGVTITRAMNQTRGRYISFNHSSSAHVGGVMSKEALWYRSTDPYIKAKFRFSVLTDWDLHIGMTSLLTDNYDDEDTANNDHIFAFVRHSSLSHGKYSIIRNDGSSNFQERQLTLSPSSNLVTIELKCDSANNRFGYRINNEDSIEPTSWTWETTNLPANNVPLGLVAMADSDTSTAFAYEIYLIETTSKLMI